MHNVGNAAHRMPGSADPAMPDYHLTGYVNTEIPPLATRTIDMPPMTIAYRDVHARK